MREGVLHVRFIRRGFDMPFERLGVMPASDEGRIKQALARHLVVPLTWLNGFVLDRHSDGDATLRLIGEE